MKLRRTSSEPEPVPEVPADGAGNGPEKGSAPKGRATPKRRDTAPRKQPRAAPRTNKEATRWRKQQAAQARTPGRGSASKMSGKEYRDAVKRGDPAALGKRDRGPVRQLARDWVDSRRLFANYFLLMIPLLFLGGGIPAFRLVTPIAVLGFLLECYLSGRRIKTLAASRYDDVRDGPWTLGFYAGTRAYLPPRFRSPQPRHKVGDKI